PSGGNAKRSSLTKWGCIRLAKVLARMPTSPSARVARRSCSCSASCSSRSGFGISKFMTFTPSDSVDVGNRLESGMIEVHAVGVDRLRDLDQALRRRKLRVLPSHRIGPCADVGDDE